MEKNKFTECSLLLVIMAIGWSILLFGDASSAVMTNISKDLFTLT